MRFRNILFLAVVVGLANANVEHEVAGVEDTPDDLDIPSYLKIPTAIRKNSLFNDSDEIFDEVADVNFADADINDEIIIDGNNDDEIIIDGNDDEIIIDGNNDDEIIVDGNNDDEIIVDGNNDDEINEFVDENFVDESNNDKNVNTENGDNEDQLVTIRVPVSYLKKYINKLLVNYVDDEGAFNTKNNKVKDVFEALKILEIDDIPDKLIKDFISDIPEAEKDPFGFIKEYIKKFIGNTKDSKDTKSVKDTKNAKDADETKEINIVENSSNKKSENKSEKISEDKTENKSEDKTENKTENKTEDNTEIKTENKSSSGKVTGAIGAVGAAAAATGIFFWVKKSKKRDVQDYEEIFRMDHKDNLIRDYEEYKMEQELSRIKIF